MSLTGAGASETGLSASTGAGAAGFFSRLGGLGFMGHGTAPGQRNGKAINDADNWRLRTQQGKNQNREEGRGVSRAGKEKALRVPLVDEGLPGHENAQHRIVHEASLGIS